MGRRATIVVDGLSALLGGGQTYLRNLFGYFSGELAHDLRVVALLPRNHEHLIDPGPSVETEVPRIKQASIAQRFAWYALELPKLLRKVDADVLYCPGGVVPTFDVGDCRTAVAFRNMLPFSSEERARYPVGYMRSRLWLLSHLQARSFRLADLVIFVSEFAKSVIDLAVGKRRGRSIVVPHGVSDHFGAPQPRPAALGLPSQYVLYVSILDFYKAQVEVVQAWHRVRQLRRTPEKLVLAGPEAKVYGGRVRQTIDSLGLHGEVLLLGSVAYDQLPALYQHAKVNVFASSCENCPNILLEALAGGRPVLCSDYAPMPEFGGNAVAYFDPYSPEQMAQSLVSLLDDVPLQSELATRALERSRQFDWAQSAQRTWTALRELAWTDR